MILLVVSVIVIALAIFNLAQRSKASRLTVEHMEDGKGIFIGERRPEYKESDPSKWSPEMRESVESHERDIKIIHESWEISRQGDNYFKMGRYEEALNAYKKAYEIGRGDESFFGKELLKAYEKLNRYDEALALLDELEVKYYKSEYGMKKAQEIRTRLLAAQNAAVSQRDNG